MKVLISGGAGFLGINLSKALLQDGHEVVVIDNLKTSRSPSVAMLNHPRFRFVEADVQCEIANEGYEFIFNLACPASPPKYQADPINTLLTSVIGTKNLLDLAREAACPLVQASTSEVYGNPLVSPQPESYLGNVNSWGPRACYDEGKRAAEALCFDYMNKYDVDVRVIRIFNTYGPHMQLDDGRIITSVIESILTERPVKIFGDGTQTRSFCYVSDLIRGFQEIMSLSRLSSPVNLGSDYEFSLNQLLDVFREVLAIDVAVEYVDSVADDPLQRRPDISRMTELTGWRPSTALEEGIRHTYNYFTDVEGFLVDNV